MWVRNDAPRGVVTRGCFGAREFNTSAKLASFSCPLAPPPTVAHGHGLAHSLSERGNRGQLEVPFVRTDDNAADLLTKAIKGVPKFFKFRSIIMNEPTPAY